MNLHLFSDPGQPGLRHIVSACRPILARSASPLVAYLPAASVSKTFLELTTAAFEGLAEVVAIDTRDASTAAILDVLDRAALVYVPGGNSYLLAERLRRAGLAAPLKERILSGLPLVAFSAGAVYSGPNILTSNDMNGPACTAFSGLGLTHYNFSPHYPLDDHGHRQGVDGDIASYHLFHDNPVLGLVDGVYLHITQDQARLVAGTVVLFEKNQPPVQLDAGSDTARAAGLLSADDDATADARS